FKCKYSSIVIYDGQNYDIKASNIEKNYSDTIKKIVEENDFKANTYKNISRYLTTSEDKTLRYKSALERNIRSCMFSPIYHNNIYLGFWILEDERENAFDEISKDELSKLKNNLGVFIENTIYQNIIETAENTDKQTGFFNKLYLYSKARHEILKFENNTFALICLNNLPEINNEFDRNIGNILISKVVTSINEFIASDTICIRYSGTRILLIMPNSTSEIVHLTIERILEKLKVDAVLKIDKTNISLNVKIVLHTIKKQNNIDKELASMVEYSDKIEESNIIKII
ncbi:MAG: diguanylate cyclase, partial [Clostridia bacterium]